MQIAKSEWLSRRQGADEKILAGDVCEWRREIPGCEDGGDVSAEMLATRSVRYFPVAMSAVWLARISL
jgi:hypothetical protein